MRVGFFSLTPASGNLSVELVLAALLHHGGDQPVFVHCDGAQPRCTVGIANSEAPDPGYCQSCHIGVRDLRQSALQCQAPTLALSSLIDPGRRQLLDAVIACAKDQDLLTLRFNDWDLGCWVEAGLRSEYFGERWQRLPDWPQKTREWLRTVGRMAIATDTFIRQGRPDCIVVLNGLTPSERAVLEVCRQRGVRCLTYEQGQSPRTLLLRENAPACLYDVTPEWGQWADVPLSIAEARRLDTYLFHRQHGATVPEYVYSPAATGDLAALRNRLRLTEERPVLTAFTNVTADSSVFEAQEAFDSQLAWLEACLHYAQANPELDLVVRVHPAELSAQSRRYGEPVITRDPVVTVLQENWPELPANVRLVGPEESVSSYDLMQLSRVCLVYVSTVGMEAAALGKPVLSAGRCHYSDKGFTWHVREAVAFAATLDRLLETLEPPPQALERVRRYLYLFYFRTCHLLPAIDALERLRVPPVDAAAFFAGMDRVLVDTAAYDEAQDHVRRYVRGEVSFAPAPPAWRHRDTAPVPAALAAPPRPQLVLLPDGSAMESCLAAVTSALRNSPTAVDLHVVAPVLTDDTRSRLTAALAPLGGAERWPHVDLLPREMPTPDLGYLLSRASALVTQDDDPDLRWVGMADDLQVPCLQIGTSDLTAFLGSLG